MSVLIIQHHWCWHGQHIMMMALSRYITLLLALASSMAPFYSVGQDNLNEVQPDIFVI